MVSVGVGRLLNLICVDDLGAMFWQHRVIREPPDPHGGPFRVMIGPSHFLMCGCCLVHGKVEDRISIILQSRYISR